MSGHRTGQLADLSLSIGNAHFIAKPFLPKDFLQVVDAILGNTDTSTTSKLVLLIIETVFPLL